MESACCLSIEAGFSEYVKKIRTVFLLKRHYENWMNVAFHNALNNEPKQTVLRDGRMIRLSGPNPKNLFGVSIGLARLLDNRWKVIRIDSESVTIQDPEGTTLRCRLSGADLGHTAEIFLTKPYGFQFDNKIIIDVGMSAGESSIFFAKHGAKLVIGLEPVVDSFELAKENIMLNGLEGVVKPINLALSSREGELSLGFWPRSLYAISGPTDHQVHPINLIAKATTIQSIYRNMGVERIDFIKMDCEGCEYDVLGSISEEILDRVNEILLEYHDGPHELPRILSNAGFNVSVRGRGLGYLHAKRACQPAIMS
jgi:FkbM family methyltransferase